MNGITLSMILWASVLGHLGDVLLKNTRTWADARFAAGMLLYASCAAVIMPIYRRADFGAVAIVWAPVSLIASLFISVLYYHEVMNLRRGIAALLALIAIALAESK